MNNLGEDIIIISMWIACAITSFSDIRLACAIGILAFWAML